ncbi:hypothetical protein MMC22_010500 [Lobaria immixta]|nr:hypothetical protein [Lobaria immixta]
MAEPFVISGAVGTAISLLNLARQGFNSLVKEYKEFRDAGQTIYDIQRLFTNNCYLMKQWNDFWMIDAPTTDEELIAFWGEEGWRLIKQQLSTIETKCEDLAALLNPFLSANHGHPPSDKEWERAQERLRTRALRKGHGNNQNSELFLEIRILEEHVTKATTRGKKAKFVFKSRQKLQNYLERLQLEYDELRRLVDAAWRGKHPTVQWNISTHQQRWLIALEETRSPIVRAARQNRKEVMDLHPFCLRTMEALDLELDLLKNTTGIPRIRCFHMIIAGPQGGTHLQVCAELAKDVPPQVASTCCTAFSDACRIAESRGQCVFRAGVVVPVHQRRPSEPNPAHFSLSRSSALLYLDQYSRFSLSRKLDRMPIAERLDLAYKVVESGLLLLDTPWLSALGSRTITRLKVSGEIPKYVLGIEEGLQDCVQQRLPEGMGKLNLHIFAIGVLLVELALGTSVSHVEIHESTVCLVKTESTKQRLSSLQRAVRQVRDEWGASCAEAVEFCLQDPTRASNQTWADGVMYDPTASEEEKSVALLDLFYEKVFLK